jgi:hypothetical protein
MACWNIVSAEQYLRHFNFATTALLPRGDLSPTLARQPAAFRGGGRLAVGTADFRAGFAQLVLRKPLRTTHFPSRNRAMPILTDLRRKSPILAAI